jgi:2-oxoglutarate dehydrogenase E2 component (dihydrolipoamide succinyltransferase)
MEILMPQLGETVDQGTISQWLKKPGDQVRVDEVLFEVETDKVTTEVPSLYEGVLREIIVAEGETAPVGARLAVLEVENDVASATATAPAAAPEQSEATPRVNGAAAARPSPAHNAPVNAERRLSPAVRRLLSEHHLDPAQITGTGAKGRITKQDVLVVIAKSGAGATARVEPAATAARPAPKRTQGVEPFSTLRKKIAEHMVRSKATSPHVLQAVEVDFSAVDAARNIRKAAFKARNGFSLTYLPFITRAVCMALREFPRLNGSVEGDALILHDDINLAFAVDLNFEGLLAPVVKKASNLTVEGLARAIADIADRARNNRLSPDDLSEGTYSITNNGSFGTVFTAPIINQPQVAILSVDGIKKKPVVVESETGDAIAIRPVGMLAQSFDHRAVDGSYSAAFLKRVQTILETNDWSRELS